MSVGIEGDSGSNNQMWFVGGLGNQVQNIKRHLSFGVYTGQPSQVSQQYAQ